MTSEFNKLPSVDRLLSEERISKLTEEFPHHLVVEQIRQQLEQERLAITAGQPCSPVDDIVEAVNNRTRSLGNTSLSRVINAGGVILHTNLGRAPLSRQAIAAMNNISSSYSNLELDLDSGKRGSRNVHIEQILCQLTGAEAALVVNNNAAAVMLALTVLARRKEVIVSRGEAVEIGGGFRIPDVMHQSGARLIEVGTTNCTYASDYEGAVNERTAGLMRVHSSNFKIMGFSHTVSLEELASLASQYNLVLFDDLGSGCLLDTTGFGLDAEPMVQESIASGASLVLFSGDKLIGGPQAGIIVGKKQLIDRLKKHPLARAMRIDKIRLAGLAVTLIHYLKGEALSEIPVWRMIAAPLTEIEQRARIWAEPLGNLARVVDGETMVGGGSLPGGVLPTKLVALGEPGKKTKGNLAQNLGQRLRCQETAVIGRINDNVLFLDPRSVLPEEDESVLKALRDAIVNL